MKGLAMTCHPAGETEPVDSSRIVAAVGVSAAAHSAVDVAADLAERTGKPLHLVRVWRDVDWFLSATAEQVAQLAAEERVEQRVLLDEYVRIRELAPSVPATCEFVPGSIYDVLTERGAAASLLVLGASEGDGASLADWFVEHAPCPVLAIRPDGSVAASTDPPVVAAVRTDDAPVG